MGDSVYQLKDGEELPVEPAGDLVRGWMAGTWVKYSSEPTTFSGAIATVERSDGTGVLAGFLIYGPQHKRPVESLSDMWKTGLKRREDGDSQYDWTATNATKSLEFDSNGLLQNIGSRIVTLYIPPTGFHKFYVFENETYTNGEPLYVSSKGYLTNVRETPNHVWTGYVVARADEDIEGDYLIAVAGMMN